MDIRSDMKRQGHQRSTNSTPQRVRNNENINSNEQQNDIPAYADKSLDMRKRLELWKEEKRKQKNDDKKTTNRASSARKGCEKRNPPFSAATKIPDRKFKTPTQSFLSPSKKDTYRDPNLDMRTRLDLWLKEKGKTPQSPRLSKQRILKTPSLTSNNRRKTWCFTNNTNQPKGSFTGGKTKKRTSHSGILKTRGSRTEEKTRKTCAFLLHDKENLGEENISYTLASLNDSMSCRENLIRREESVLRCSLEKCFNMLNEGCNKQDEVVFSLDDIQRDNPNVLRHALYWICRAKLAENAGDHQRVVCMFDQASAFSAQPEDEIMNAFDAYKKRQQVNESEENKSPILLNATLRTPHKTPSRELSALDGEVFNSSVVRFCLMDSTPFRKRRKSTSEKRVLTPVRRTTRWERCGISHPKTIEEKNLTVASLNELSNELRAGLVFKPNYQIPCELNKELLDLDVDEF